MSYPGQCDGRRKAVKKSTWLGYSKFGLLLMLAPASPAQAADERCYEMRTYYASPGKALQMHTRFRDHTHKLFQKHGMTPVGYWVPIDAKDGGEDTLVYVLSYPSREAREKSWKAFMADPDWQAAFKASETDGRLVAKVEQRFLQATDYSPPIKAAVAGESRLFELRTYTAAPGRLANLNARFRDFTLGLFKKHGMENIAYWTPAAGEPGADNTLIYIVAHQNREGRDAAFKSFGADPDWVAARKASEEKAGGSLTEKGGVKSLLLRATDYSPMK
jgi:hypothetical protein